MSEPDPPDGGFGLVPDAEADRGLDPGLGLDPEQALLDRGAHHRAPRSPPPVIDTRRYQWMIGALGILLVIVFSVLLYARGGSGTPGLAAGQRMHHFVAPLAAADLASVTSNTHPRCDPAHPAARGLNVCGRRSLVLAFFALGAGPCIRQIDVLQRVSGRFPHVQFAAVAVHAGRDDTRALIRRHHWTIPVAYDLTGVVGELYGVAVCPLVEIVGSDGIIARRLIGEHWSRPGTLAGAVARPAS